MLMDQKNKHTRDIIVMLMDQKKTNTLVILPRFFLKKALT